MRAVERARFATVGFIGGVAAGLLVWSTQVERSRRELFNRSPVRRFAALGFLAGRPGLDTARLLADYVNWETRPVLRRRGQLLLRRMEAHLD
ncbi:MAG: hypothetical protein HOQ17_13145 [Gemmatimonadaceae bacterium]|nr:hypothetical protein [Gemmatimonadaceae bacterium]HWJ45898.1 hypothetical protein [Gaiellaceae bacterium]NUO93367.1 hypothetical protein [Gemmatimonadaceae bacterium]NUP56987.1 hypothetical protein [Gemmatimonadaceae bacterium]NUP72458.1 hypothetical protein [Gemmatimonadaceae bacterium]